jgi:folate-binding protein YgfZ
MFVMRAKAVLEDASADFAVFGCLQAASATADPAPWSLDSDGAATRIHLYPGAACSRSLWIGPAGTRPSGPEAPLADWLYSEVMSGVATISQPLYEALVPQMLNYESVGGVNFKKGCYPGQEVVARSQFRGTLKRRAYIVRGEAPMEEGQAVFSAQDAACAYVRTLDDAVFARENPNEKVRSRFPTVGTAIAFMLTSHVMMHFGQVSAWRRCYGLPSAMG